MNKIFFNELVNGHFGRKTAYANVETVTEENIVSVIGKAIGIHYFNRAAIEYLWNYYHGDQPILYREKLVRNDIVNKICENHAFEIVQFKTGQTYGEAVQCISRSNDENINKAVDKFNDYLKDSFKPVRDIELGEWQSAVGVGYKAVQYATGDLPFRILVLDPRNTFIVKSEITHEPILAVQILKDENNKQYYMCYTDTHECKVQNGKIIPGSWKIHAFGGIPIVEYANNSEKISDIELVIGILDAINTLQSNRVDSVEQFVQFCMVFTNCDVDEDSIKDISKTGAISLKTNNKDNKASFDIIDKELDQTQTQTAKDDLWNNALSISAIPNKQGSNAGGSDTQGAVSLRNGWDFSKTRAKMKDPIVVEAEKRMNKCILNILRIRKGANDCPIRFSDYDVQIVHSPTDNLVVKCQALQYLKECGIHPLVAIRTIGLWGDAEKVFMLSKEYIDAVWSTIPNADEQEAKAKELLGAM